MVSAFDPGHAAGLAAATAVHRELGAAYPVTLDVFEGPLDLLLHLIEQEKLDISEVSLVAVTDQYLRSIEQMERPAPGALADFMVVASRLLYIKSLRLLPKPAITDDEEEDAGAQLVRHLLEYRQFKAVAEALRLRESDLRVFTRPPAMMDVADLRSTPSEFGELDATLLRKALAKALSRIVAPASVPNVQPYTVTVAERMDGVRRRFAELARQGDDQLSFDALLAESDSRLAIIVTFLAVLELVKQHELVADQMGPFGTIMLVSVKAGSALAPATEDEVGSSEETGSGEAEDAE